MHDLDRTLQEFEAGYDALESYDDEFGDEFEFEFEWDGEGESDDEAVFDEIEEMELAAALLEVQDEEELEQFLGSLIKKAGRSIGKVVKSPIGKALGGVLKKVAKTALPMAGAALGNLVVPGAGGLVGGKLASMAGKMFGLELEGMSPQDQEFEVARRVVRLAGAATKQAVKAPTSGSPVAAAKNAVAKAAQTHAPGLSGGSAATTPNYTNGSARGVGARSGRWFRRGRRIVLLGI
jgi:hypothetical protein